MPAPPLSITTSTTNLMDTRRTQDATQATAGGMYHQLTTSGGRDLGERYVEHILFRLLLFLSFKLVLYGMSARVKVKQK